MNLDGKALKYGDNINTDIIIPGKYTKTLDMNELAAHAMEDLDENFHQRLTVGDFVVGGENFGCGSSREQAPLALKYAGVGCVVAKSFSRIFYRNCINVGLPLIICDTDKIDNNDELKYEIGSESLVNLTKNSSYLIEKFPDVMVEILNAGGLIDYLKNNNGTM